jgi:hypothetical protein
VLTGALGASLALCAAPAAGSSRDIQLTAPKNARVVHRRLSVTGKVACPPGRYAECTALAYLYVVPATKSAKPKQLAKPVTEKIEPGVTKSVKFTFTLLPGVKVKGTLARAQPDARCYAVADLTIPGGGGGTSSAKQSTTVHFSVLNL